MSRIFAIASLFRAWDTTCESSLNPTSIRLFATTEKTKANAPGRATIRGPRQQCAIYVKRSLSGAECGLVRRFRMGAFIHRAPTAERHQLSMSGSATPSRFWTASIRPSASRVLRWPRRFRAEGIPWCGGHSVSTARTQIPTAWGSGARRSRARHAGADDDPAGAEPTLEPRLPVRRLRRRPPLRCRAWSSGHVR
jgi:hypothetical protein